MTFHSLARLILRKSSLPTTVSPFAQQPKLQSAWLEDWLCKKIEDNTLFINKILSTIYLVERNPINNEMNISTSKSHSIFQTLPGYKVSNYPEYIIANYLYLNGIEHEFKQSSTYKSTANVPGNISIFTLAADNICIEYCQKTTKNNTVLTKNRAYDSTNIRLTFADYNEGIIITKLCQFLNVAFSIKKINAQAIIAQLSRIGLLKKAVDSYLKALQTIKIENLSVEEIQNRIALINIENTEQFSEILHQISDAYKTELLKDNSIDFDDMIINANDAVSKKIFVPKWEHILVDEFQDISSTRYKFIASLITFGNIEYKRKNHPRIKKVKLTAVGDDWQSIYRFSGGNLELTTQFKKLVGTHTLSILQKTFRYNDSIADIAGKFIMENPEQYKKNVITNTQVDKPQVFLHDDVSRIEKSVKSIEQKIMKITQSIIKNNAKESIAIITRYRKQLNEIQSYFLYESKNPDSLIKSHSKDIFSHEKISFWTYHGSKGLEADNTILVGFENGFFGFPPTNQSKSLVDALLPKVDSYPHSEERRLMYVGLTRAKNKVHLIVDPNNCSVFIKELIKDKYDIKILSTNLKT
jgi:DNA helicase-4